MPMPQPQVAPATPAMTVPTQTPPPVQTLQLTDESRSMMLMLLNRVEQVTSDQMKQDSKAGQLTVDRAKLDEILANVSQVKTMLQK